MTKNVPCPICRQSAIFDESNKFRPFCSHRCQLIDLGEWFNEERKIAGEAADPNDPSSNADS